MGSGIHGTLDFELNVSDSETAKLQELWMESLGFRV